MSATPPSRLYFPIRHTRNEFNRIISKDFLGIETSCPDVYNTIESIQPYNDEWLSKFNQLNNNNKHQDLEEQTRTETKLVTVSPKQDNSKVIWRPDNVTFSVSGVSVFGVPVDPRTQMPVPNKLTETKVEIWIDFKFRENGKSVLPFIQKSIDSVEELFNDIGSHIYNV